MIGEKIYQTVDMMFQLDRLYLQMLDDGTSKKLIFREYKEFTQQHYSSHHDTSHTLKDKKRKNVIVLNRDA